MVKFQIGDIKKMFFDRAAISGAVDKATRSVLSKFGAFVMTASRRSIKPAKQMTLAEMSIEEQQLFKRRAAIAKAQGKPRPKRPRASSKPGQPPRSQLGILRRFILFGYDTEARSVVVGPARLNGVKGGPDALSALEEGGNSRNAKGKSITVAARPFMGPALEREKPKLPAMWANSVKG
jgi:hypothetical protein